MTKELETLLTELYVLIEDHLAPVRRGRGRRPAFSDAELVTFAVAQMLMGFSCERRWIRHAHRSPELRAMFPYLPQQPGYHKRLKAAYPLLGKTVMLLARLSPSWHDDLWITDATPVPCGMSRETAKRSDLVGHAGYGYCASHSRYYWGLKLYLVCAGDEMPIMWGLAHPKLGEREVVTALLDHNHQLIRTGQILLADNGFSGQKFHHHATRLGLRLLRPDRKDETYRNGSLGSVRQWIESVNHTLKDQLGLERHGGRTPTGVFTRVAQRILALAAGIWQNWATNTTAKRSLIAYDI